MKKSYIILVVLFLFASINNSHAQTANWQWGKQGVGKGNGFSCTADISGNMFVTGWYDTTITFGSVTLSNAGNYHDIFLVKYSAAGTVLWAQNAGGSSDDQGNSVCSDLSGNVYITGRFASPTIIFGTDTLRNKSNTTLSDIFIAKYSPSGTVLWAKSFGGISFEEGNSIATDAQGNMFITGTFHTGIITIGTTTLTNFGMSDIFIAKYSPSGTFLWAKNAGGNDTDWPSSIAVDISGNTIITGNFASPSIKFENIALTVTGSGISDMFIAKYSSSGAVIWAKSTGGTCYTYGSSVATDAFDNIYLTGSFCSPNIVFGSDTLINADGYDMYIVKYSSTGTILGAKKSGGNGTSLGRNIATDATGVYLAGTFNSSLIHFGSDTLLRPTGGPIAMFVVKYDSDLNVICVSGLPSGIHGNYPIATDNLGNAYIAGSFNNTNPLIIGTDTLILSDKVNVFFAKYNCNGTNGINEVAKKEIISIYPNPFNSETNLSFNETQRNTSVKITDILGKEMKVFNFSGNQLIIEKGEMKPGVYFIQISNEQKIITNKKIIIQ